MRVGSLFAGYDGLGLAVESLWPESSRAWFVEFDPAPSRILAHHWPDVPNHGDVTAVDWAAIGPVDVLTGGFPCQDLSHAGKRAGLKPGTRSGLWTHMAYAIDQLRPSLVVIENVRGLLSAEAHSDLERDCWCVGDAGDPDLRALGAVLGDLAGIGYDAQWCGLRAADVGACHGRFRVFIVAQPAAGTDGAGLEGWRQAGRAHRRDPGAEADVTLLPTPTVVDRGAKMSVSEWDAWTARMRISHGNGNGHGASLAIEALRRDTWGVYGPAIARWEQVTNRDAPPPTQPNKSGQQQLSPQFVEWMMGLPAGHVTDPAIGLSRAQQLKALGNGVVPQQAAAALRMLLGEPR